MGKLLSHRGLKSSTNERSESAVVSLGYRFWAYLNTGQAWG